MSKLCRLFDLCQIMVEKMLSEMSFFLRSVKREYLCTSKEAICFLGYIFKEKRTDLTLWNGW